VWDGWGRRAAERGDGGEVERRRTAVARRGKRVNALPALVSSRDCTGKLRAPRVTHLGALGVAELAGAAVQR
jgi:hypothetical protein